MIKGCKIGLLIIPLLFFLAGRDLHRATPAEKQGLGFIGLTRGAAPFSRFVRQAKVSGELF